MKFIKEKQSILLSLDSEQCKLTKGLHTTLFLNGLGFWNLQPKFAFMFGGADAFCKAWALFMKVEFDGDVEKFYEQAQNKHSRTSAELGFLARFGSNHSRSNGYLT
jgi:hypothetical protein